MQGKRIIGGLVAACIGLVSMIGTVGLADTGEGGTPSDVSAPEAVNVSVGAQAIVVPETENAPAQTEADPDEPVDYYAKAQSNFARARKLFGEIADHCEGSLKKSAASAMGNAKIAEAAIKNKGLKDALDAANRAKLDAVLTAATAQQQDSINAAIRGFDTQINAYASAPEDEKAEQLAKVAEKLAALAKALKSCIITESAEETQTDKKA